MPANRPKTKDVEVNGNRYQLRKLDALVASWMVNLLVAMSQKLKSSSAPNAEKAQQGQEEIDKLSPEEQAQGLVSMFWVMAGAELDEDRYRRIQLHALRCCLRYTEAGTHPVIMGDNSGRYTFADLEDDPKALNKLIIESLQFNLCPFFIEDALSEPGLSDRVTTPPNASK